MASYQKEKEITDCIYSDSGSSNLYHWWNYIFQNQTGSN